MFFHRFHTVYRVKPDKRHDRHPHQPHFHTSASRYFRHGLYCCKRIRDRALHPAARFPEVLLCRPVRNQKAGFGSIDRETRRCQTEAFCFGFFCSGKRYFCRGSVRTGSLAEDACGSAERIHTGDGTASVTTEKGLTRAALLPGQSFFDDTEIRFLQHTSAIFFTLSDGTDGFL